MRRSWIAVAAVIALAGVAAGCGGSDSEAETDPTAAWASGFCTAVTDASDELQSIVSQFSDPSNLTQDALASAAEDAKSVTQGFVDEVKSLGTPDTSSGEAVKSSVDDLTTTIETQTQDIEETVDGISGITDLPNAITSISSSLTALNTALSGTIQTIENADAGDELKQAFNDSPECTSLTS